MDELLKDDKELVNSDKYFYFRVDKVKIVMSTTRSLLIVNL